MDIQQAVETYKQTQDDRDLKVVIKMIEIYAHRETKKKRDEHEAKSDLNYVIFQTVDKYDLSKNIKFITYFWRSYKNFAVKKFNEENTKKNAGRKNEVSLHNQFYDDGEELESVIPSKTRELDDTLFQADVTRILSGISDKKDAFILQKLCEGYQQNEIARMMNMTVSGVNHRALAMRHKRYGVELRELLKDYMAEVY